MTSPPNSLAARSTAVNAGDVAVMPLRQTVNRGSIRRCSTERLERDRAPCRDTASVIRPSGTDSQTSVWRRRLQ